MVRFLIRIAILLASAALGLLVASWTIKDVHLHASGFIVTVAIFTVVQTLLAPFIEKSAQRYAPAFLGGIGLVTTCVSMAVAANVGDGLSITGGIGPWILATIVVWVVSAVGSFILPFVLLRQRKAEAKKSAAPPKDRPAAPPQAPTPPPAAPTPPTQNPA